MPAQNQSTVRHDQNNRQPFPSAKLPLLLVILGIIGLIASFALTLEKFALLENPNYIPSCSLNPVVSCGSIIDSQQSSAFGFANSLLGIAGFSVVVTIGVAGMAGARFKRWFWLGLQTGSLLATAFVHWLIFQSLYRIGALCPYCMVVWAVTIPIFWYVLLFNLQAGHIRPPAAMQKTLNWLQANHLAVLSAWFLAVVSLILVRFWYYWQTLI